MSTSPLSADVYVTPLRPYAGSLAQVRATTPGPVNYDRIGG
jgi:hypothetical protein